MSKKKPRAKSPTAEPPPIRPVNEAPISGPWDRLLTAAVMLWTFLSLCFPLSDTDFWWHLKTGELILERGLLPQVDWYTYTDLDKPWIDLHWGFQLLITWLWRLGGANLVILTKAAVTTLAVWIAWQAAGRSLPAWKKTLVWVPAIIAISGRGYERPEMLSLLCLAAWLWIAHRVDERPRLIWLLPAIQLLWVNCHALFVLGLVLGACYVIDAVARDFAQGRYGLAPPAAAPPARWIIWSGALVFLACFANPYFEEGALFPLTLYRKFSLDQELYASNGEFQRPIDFLLQPVLHPIIPGRDGQWLAVARRAGNVYLLAEFALWCIAATSFVLLWRRNRRVSVFRLLLFAAFSHLAWKATRNTNIFSIVAAVTSCGNLADLAPVPLTESLRTTRTRGGFLIVAALIVAVVTGGWNRIGDRNKPFGFGEAKNWFIHEAAKFAGQPGFPEHAFIANNGQASVYTYHNYNYRSAPERRVFMDGRLEVCSPATWIIYSGIMQRMMLADPAWQEPFRQKGTEPPVVILDNSTLGSWAAIQGILHTPGWRMVYADQAAAVFLTDEKADELELPAADVSPVELPPPARRGRE